MTASSQAPLLTNAFPRGEPSSMLATILRTPADWDTLVAARSICRLRLGLLTLGAKGDRPSRARVVQCVACGRPTVAPLAHTLLRCEAWASFRHPPEVWQGASLQEILCLQPESAGFNHFASMAVAVERHAKAFWSAKPGALRRMWP